MKHGSDEWKASCVALARKEQAQAAREGDKRKVKRLDKMVDLIAKQVAEPAPTVVVFRTFKDSGQVIALFPECSFTYDRYECSSYMRVGQHAAASPYLGLINRTTPSTEVEIAPLASELRSLGYVLTVRKKITQAMHEKRFADLARVMARG